MQVLTRKEFLKTFAGAQAKAELLYMVKSSAYSTASSYDVSVGRELAFIDRHINYLARHPYLSPVVYIVNLKVMTKIRR